MKLKRLINKSDSKVEVVFPVSNEEIADRQKDAPLLDDVAFAKKYRDPLFKEVSLKIENTEYKIQANFCTNPFCKWFGMLQHKYDDIKSKPSRYKLDGDFNQKKVHCNEINVDDCDGIVVDHRTMTLSNWSLAEEIKRLIDINTVTPMDPGYTYHKEDCSEVGHDPFNCPDSFYRRGRSSSNSQKYQCKKCGKITNILPDQRRSFTYHQKRNDVLPKFALQILNRTPVTRTLELLNIGASTYYNKLEWLHRRCLEFLERYETKPLQEKHFDNLWLNTDKFSYYLNNIRKKGRGNNYTEQERPLFPTYIIATVDAHSRYTFRADLAFDYNITPEEIERDIEILQENRLYNFAQRNARYRYSYYGINDGDVIKEKEEDDLIDKDDLQLRKDYIEGFHVNSTYTAFAQYWLIRRMLNADEITYVCDEDSSIISSLMRVYADRIKEGSVNIFTCRTDKSLNKKDAYREWSKAIDDIAKWQEFKGLKGSTKDAAVIKFAHDLENHRLYDKVYYNGKVYPSYAHNPIQHPLPYKDEGIRYVDCLTDLSRLSSSELAEQLMKVDMRAVNTFFNQIRRRASILERPLVLGRGEGKSYIYSNFNPRYAHYMLTILRTYLNFCVTFKYRRKEVTPAMLLGITERPYSIEEIIYLK